MKYPIGTKCWVVMSAESMQHHRGHVVTVTSHYLQRAKPGCLRCGSVSSEVETDAFEADNPWPIVGCCHCNLVPIDDPDAGIAVEEAEELEA